MEWKNSNRCCSWKDSLKIKRKLYRIHPFAPKVRETISDCEELPKAVPLVILRFSFYVFAEKNTNSAEKCKL